MMSPKQMVDALGMGNVRVTVTITALAMLAMMAGWLAVEYADAQRIKADVRDLKTWKSRVVEEGWLPPSLAQRLTTIEEGNKEILAELRGLRMQVSAGRSENARAFRMPESSRGDK